jgi:hypothetical protein
VMRATKTTMAMVMTMTAMMGQTLGGSQHLTTALMAG